MNKCGKGNQQDNSIARSELKYLISEDVAERVREGAAQFMDRDPHTSPAGTYPVHTIYLDSPDLVIYRKSLNREADRFKLRIRFYDDDASSPVFLEIKRATVERGIKKRLAVRREAANALFSDCAMNSAGGRPFDDFWQAVTRFEARPIVHIAYAREAFVGRDDPSTRLTLDRQVRFEPVPKTLSTKTQSPIPIWNGKIILEVKFPEAMPEYIFELIQALGIETTKASKYLQSVSTRIEADLGRACPKSKRNRISREEWAVTRSAAPPKPRISICAARPPINV